MNKYFGLLVFVLSSSVLADNIYTVVGYKCDSAKDVLLLTYDGAYDSAGEELVRNKSDDQWDLWSLYYDRKPIKKSCNLSDGEYKLTISSYHSGSCDVCYGIWVKVTNGSNIVFNEGLHGFEGPPAQTVITRAVIKSHDSPPELTRLLWDDFVERVHLAE